MKVNDIIQIRNPVQIFMKFDFIYIPEMKPVLCRIRIGVELNLHEPTVHRPCAHNFRVATRSD